MTRMFWVFILLVSLLVGAFCISSIPEQLQIQEVVKANRKVSVAVLKCTEIHIGKTHVYTLRFEHESEIRNLRVGKEYLDKYCNQREAKLLHLVKYSNLFIQPGYRVNNESVAQIALIIMTLACSVYAALQLLPAKLAFKK